MKAKHWIVVGVIAVLCIGAAVLLYNKTSEEGVPADAGVESSVPAATEEPTATEEPVSTEEPVENIVYDYEKEPEVEETTPVVEEEEEPELTPDTEDLTPEQHKTIEKIAKEEGVSIEEATKMYWEVRAAAREENQRIKERLAQEREAERARLKHINDTRAKMCLEQTGMTIEEFFKDGNGLRWCEENHTEPYFMSYKGE